MTRIDPRTAAKTALSLLLSLGLAFPLAPMAAAQGTSLVAAAVTGESRRSLEALSALLDPSEYDVEALTLDMAFEDAEYIAAWVADNLAYQVYPGLLRGPQGTLVAGAGNALDLAVLLATLLAGAGYDSRVVLGELSDQDASTLVMSMFDESTADGTAAQALDDADVARLAVAAGTDPAGIAAAAEEFAGLELRDLPAFADAVVQAEAIVAEMDLPLDTSALPELVAEARHYAWVEYRLGETATWETAQPAWPSSAAAPEVTGIQVLEDEVPPELIHHLRIEVTVERKRGDEFETAALMTPWQRPVANLLGYPLVVGNTALGPNGASDLATMSAELIESAFYAPILNGALAPGAKAFDLAGNLLSPEDATSSMAGVFQTTSSRLGDAVGALGAMGGDEPPVEPFALTAQWVDFVLVAPGGEETRHRRTVFDRRPAEARAAGTLELLDESALLENLISTYVVMASGGAVAPAYVASQLYEQALFHLDVIDSLSALRSSGTSVSEEVLLLEALADYVPKDHLGLFASSDAVDSVARGVAYRAEPSVIALVGTLTPGSQATVRSGVDIIANAKRTVHAVADDVLYDVQAGVLAGTWDTAVEREFVKSTGRTSDNALNGATTPLAVLRPDDRGLLAGVPEHAATAVRNDLANGYTIVAPVSTSDFDAAVEGSEYWSYWRVDRATGETLGMNAAGHGAALTEYQMGLIVAGTVNTALAVPGIAICMGSNASWTCYCDIIVGGVGMTLVGALFASLVAAKWALTAYAIVDIGVVGPITTAIYTPPICSGWEGVMWRGNPIRAGQATGAACWTT